MGQIAFSLTPVSFLPSSPTASARPVIVLPDAFRNSRCKIVLETDRRTLEKTRPARPCCLHRHAVKTLEALGLATRENQFEYCAEKMNFKYK